MKSEDETAASVQNFWFLAVTAKVPDGVTGGVMYSDDSLAAKESYSDNDVDYGLICRAAAKSREDARNQLTSWFQDSGVPAPIQFLDISTGGRRISRKERQIVEQMQEGDVRIRSCFFAWKKGDDRGRKEVIALVDEVVFKKAWQFWR